jgi:hypothetical protein
MIDKLLDAIIAAAIWGFYAVTGLLWLMLVLPIFYHLVKFITGLFK